MLFHKTTITDLPNFVSNTYLHHNNLREKIRLLIIDDNDVPYIDSLRRLSFNVSHKNDIEEIKDVEPYEIIICDIKGVGRKISKDKEGAAIIQNIKKLYPEKGVIAYSGGTFDITLNQYFALADDIIRKGTDSSDIANILDSTIKKVLDPIRLWQKIFDQLSDSGLNRKQIEKIQGKYVESIETGDISSFEQRIKKVLNNVDYVTIINGVAALINLYAQMKG